MRKQIIFFVFFFIVGYSQSFAMGKHDGQSQIQSVKGKVAMIVLGAKSCLPCRMMIPILEKLEKDYKGKAAISFVDIKKHGDQISNFGIKAIPTQIFFDKNGNEVYRHVGFMDEKEIVKQLKKMGVSS